MRDVTTKNFGLLIAYLLPGFTVLWAASRFSATVQGWLGGVSADAPTVGGFLYITVSSVAAGLTVSVLRFLVVDRLHHATGIAPPEWDFGRMQANLTAFDLLNEQHYRHYQFYANMLVALAINYGVRLWELRAGAAGLLDAAYLGAAALLLIGSRDTLRRYYDRVAALL